MEPQHHLTIQTLAGSFLSTKGGLFSFVSRIFDTLSMKTQELLKPDY